MQEQTQYNKTSSIAKETMKQVRENLQDIIIGQKHLVDNLLIALLAEGHILLEGLPGLAKTLAANALAKTISADFKRIQFTPDLLPSDLVGTEIFQPQKGIFEFYQGPLFSNIILADEINRAASKVQSALLEAMAERQITVAHKSYQLPEFFMVIATQNPIEQEGTFNLPEAQLDRFLLHVNVAYPTKEEELQILKLSEKTDIASHLGKLRNIPLTSITQMRKEVSEIFLDDSLKEYIVSLILATRSPEKFSSDLAEMIELGASPRATIGLARAAKAYAFLLGDDYVTPYHIQHIAPNILRHRIGLSFKAEADNITKDEIIEKLLLSVAV